ncbi:MAG: hypothetical protein CMJ89_00625 [Planctomycetes bacterium]|nr:hypothetical protein [Planctomycetota bacterium]
MLQPDEDAPTGVPPILHSVFAKGPFETCVDCGAGLLDAWTPYAVEKVIRQGEVVLEFAICVDCQIVILREFSEESIDRIREYTAGTLNQSDEIDRILEVLGHQTEDRLGTPPPPTPAPDRCQRCGAQDDAYTREHSIGGILIGDRLIANVSSLCGKCSDGLDQVLSQKTREAHDDFIERNFPGVPAELDLPVGAIGL